MSRSSSWQQDTEHFPLLPTQYETLTGGHAAVEPERRLLLAILTDAIVTFQARGASVGSKRRTFDEAARWLFSNDRMWPCSFVNVCEALGIAPEPLRRALVDWHRRHDDRAAVRAARRRLLAGKDVRTRAAAGC